MPYQIEFSKPVALGSTEHYFNECCYGGDIVSQELLPLIAAHYNSIRAEQEDWGWFIWFRDAEISLAVDIFCDDPSRGTFRIHLNSSKRRWLWFRRTTDTPELERLKDLVVEKLSSWVGRSLDVRQFDVDA